MLSRATQAKLALYFCGMIVLHADVLWQSGESVARGLPDFSIFYTAGRIVRDGQGPRLYDDSLQEPVQRSFAPLAAERRGGAILPYNHLPFEVLLFVPLARFSFVTAYAIWLIVNVALLCSIPCVLRRRLPALGKAPLYLWLLACFAFYPIFMALIQGQDSILLLFLYCLAYEALERRSELAAGGWLALGLYKYHLVLPFVGSLWRRNKLIAGFLMAAGGLGPISLAITGWHGLAGYPRYVWGTEHDPKYVLNSLQGQTANLRGLISAMVPAMHSTIGTGLVIFFSVIVLLVMINAAARVSWEDSTCRQALLALNLVGTILISYHIYVHDLSVLFLAILLVLEVLISGRFIPRWMRAVLWVCIAILSSSPAYMVMSLGYHQLQLMAIVLGIFFAGLIGVINFLSAKTGAGGLLPASEGR
jgi:Glycosyltransferase family 87